MSRGGEEGGGPFSRAGVSSTGAGRDAVQPEAVRTEGLSRQQEQQDGGQQSGAQPSHASAARGSRRLRTAIRTRARRAIAPLIYTKTQIARTLSQHGCTQAQRRSSCDNVGTRCGKRVRVATSQVNSATSEGELRQSELVVRHRRIFCDIRAAVATMSASAGRRQLRRRIFC